MVYTFTLFVFMFVKTVSTSVFPMQVVEKSLVSWKTLFATRFLNVIIIYFFFEEFE